MMFGNPQRAQPQVAFQSTGAAALAALGPSDRIGPTPCTQARSTESQTCSATAVKAGSVWSLTASIAAATALVMAVTSVVSSVVETPTSLDSVTVITAAQGSKLMAAGVPMIDTRSPTHYDRERIRGALNVPYEDGSANDLTFDHTSDSFDLAKLPGDKNAPLIFYCNARVCWKSYKASKVAAAAGYKHVNWLRGGLMEWAANGYPIATYGARRRTAR